LAGAKTWFKPNHTVTKLQDKKFKQLEKVANWQLTMHWYLRPPNMMPLPHFGSFKSELQMNPMSLHLDSLCGATLMPLKASAVDWGWNRILRVGKTPIQF